MATEIQIDNVNIGKANPHDGTRGRWIIIPAEGRILLKDEISDKVYEINMTEITAYDFISNDGDVNLNIEEQE